MLSSVRYYILVGDRENWLASLSQNIWGFSEKSKRYWNTSNIGDYVAFYVTNPTKRIIGYGQITGKFVSDEIIWSDERLFGKAIWRYRLKFKKDIVINNWEKGVPVPRTILLNIGRKVVDKKTYFRLIRGLQQFES